MPKQSKHRTEQAGGAHTVLWQCGECGKVQELPAWQVPLKCNRYTPGETLGESTCAGVPRAVIRSIEQQTQRTHLNQAQQAGAGAAHYAQRAAAFDAGQAYTMARIAARCAIHYVAAGGVWPVPAEVQV